MGLYQRTRRTRKGLLEVFKRLSPGENLLCDPVLGRDGGNIGDVLSPHEVGFMLTATDTSSRLRLRLGGCRVLAVKMG